MTSGDTIPLASTTKFATTDDRAEPPSTIVPAPELCSAVPVSLFASIMGLAALSIAWTTAEVHLSLSNLASAFFGILAIFGFVALAAGYSVKLIRYPHAVRDEFANPVTRNFFGMPLICLLLLPVVIAPASLAAAGVLWWLGMTGMIVFAWTVLACWFGKPQQRASVTTAWLVVAVGLLDIPLAMPALGIRTAAGAAQVFFVLGLTLATTLYGLIVPRYLFDASAPAAQAPTLLIAAAPLGVGFSSYVTVYTGVDRFAEWLFVLAMIVLAALAVPVGRALVRLPFRLSWWGTSFPVAATAGAATRFAVVNDNAWTVTLAGGVLMLATGLILWLLLCTLHGIVSGRLRELLT